MISSGTLTIPSRTSAIDDARRWAAAHLASAGASANVVWEVEMALTEALANVIVHGYAGDESGTIALALSLEEGGLELEIVDHGEPFDESGYAPPDLADVRAGGYGLHLIEELVDEVDRVAMPDGGTRLRLVKRRWREDG